VFIHSVYFWLKEGLKEGDLEQFKRGLKSLTGIESVRRSYIGVPASTDRPVIERGYSYSLILTFDDKKGHDAYQEDEVHERFRQDCSPCWSKVVIYDCVEASHLDD
jgi:hypothetical protein